MASTPLIPRRKAIITAIEGNAPLRGVLRGDLVYLGKAEPGAPLPYIVLALTTETDEGAGYFDEPGHIGTTRLHCWAADKAKAEEVYALLYVVLHRVPLPIGGHQFMRGRLSVIADVEDPTRQGYQIAADYQVWTLEGGA